MNFFYNRFFLQSIVMIILYFGQITNCNETKNLTKSSISTINKENPIIKYIKSKTDLTQADAARWKLFWLKSFANPVAVITLIYALYKVGQFGYNIPVKYQKQIENIFKGEYTPSLVNKLESFESGKWLLENSKKMEPLIKNEWAISGLQSVESLAKSKFLWTSVVFSLAADKVERMWSFLIGNRIQMIILDRIEKYVNFCNTLNFAKKKYTSAVEFGAALPDRTWCDYGVNALIGGFDCLIEQGNIALSLIEQLKKSGASKERLASLNNNILLFINNITYNKQLISEEALKNCKNPASALEIFAGALELVFLPWKLLFRKMYID